jgi:hypothetical protein
MPQKPPSSLADRDLVLTADQMKQGQELLRCRIAEIEAFDPRSVGRRWDPQTRAIEASVDGTLSKVFGPNTPRYYRYEPASRMDRGPLTMSHEADPLYQVHQWLEAGKKDALALLNEALKYLENDPGAPTATSVVQK